MGIFDVGARWRKQVYFLALMLSLLALPHAAVASSDDDAAETLSVPAVSNEQDRKKMLAPGHLAYEKYTIGAGNTEIQFPMVVRKASFEPGYYFAQNFNFVGHGIGYMGIRPRPNGTFLAAFSYFALGAKSEIVDKKHCRSGADGNKGVSCSYQRDFKLGTTYTFVVRRDKNDQRVWRGYVKEGKKGKEEQIGAWRIADVTTLGTSNVAFVEYYLVGKKHWTCEKLTPVEIVFGVPKGNASGKGALGRPYEYDGGMCFRNAGFKTGHSSKAYWIKIK